MTIPDSRTLPRTLRGLALLVAGIVAIVGCARPGDGSATSDAPSPNRAATGAQLNVNRIPNPEKTGWHGAVLPTPVDKPVFTLTDTAGQPYDFQAETAGKVTLLFFGYTNCPDICPLHMANIAAAMDQTGLAAGKDVEVVFVSADPERDTPERLREFLDNFNDEFVGLTDDKDRVVAVMRQLGLPPPSVSEIEGRDGYLVAHPAQVIAFTPDNQAHLVYPFGVGAAAFVADLPRLVAEGFTQ
jgi:protein SCO1